MGNQIHDLASQVKVHEHRIQELESNLKQKWQFREKVILRILTAALAVIVGLMLQCKGPPVKVAPLNYSPVVALKERPQSYESCPSWPCR